MIEEKIDSLNLTKLNNFGLNFRELRFLRAYLVDPCATRAVLESYATMSYNSARAYGCALLKKNKIKMAIKVVMEEQKIDREFIMRGLVDEIETPAITASERMVRIRAIQALARLMGLIGGKGANTSSLGPLDEMWRMVRNGRDF